MRFLSRGLLLLWLMSFSSHAWAEFSLTPGLEMRLSYDDNIYLDPDNEEDDFIAKATPSLIMKWVGPRIDLSLDARIGLEKYLDHTDEDRIGPSESDQASTFNALVKIYPDVFFLQVTDTYQRVPTDEGDRGGEGNNVVNLTDSNRLIINPYLQFETLGDLQVKLGYSYENLWYGNGDSDDAADDDGDGDDTESHDFTLGLTKPLSSRVSLTLDGSHLLYRPKNAISSYDPDEDGVYEYDRDSVRIGLNYQVNERLLLKGGYGHAWLDYDQGYEEDSSTWDFAADYEISSTLQSGLAFNSNYAVSVEDGPSESTRYSAFIAYADRITVRAAAFASNSKYVEQNREDDAFGGELGGTLPFTDKTGVDWRLSYTNYDETGPDAEEYDRYGATLSLYHDIRLARLSLGYTYNRNDSDLEDNDYTSNIVFAAASFTF